MVIHTLDKPLRSARERSRPAMLKQARLALVLLLCLTAAPAQAKPINPKQYAQHLLNPTQYQCLNFIIIHESNWNHKAISPTHDYGIPQRHMKQATQKQITTWLQNPIDQIDWMIHYITNRYQTPCQAKQHKQTTGWY